MALIDPTTGKKLDKIYTKQATDRKPIMKIVSKVDGQRKTIYYHPDYTIQKLWVDAGHFAWADANKNKLVITDQGLQQEYLPDVVDGWQLTSIEGLYPDKYNIRYNVLRRFPIVDLSNVENANNAFTGLKTEGALILHLPKLRTAQYMFFRDLDNGYITDITLNVPNKVDFTQAFAGRMGLHTISLTGNGHIVDYLGSECYDLRKLNLDLENTLSIEALMFATEVMSFTSNFSDVKMMGSAYYSTQNMLEFAENADKVEDLVYTFANSNFRKVVIPSTSITNMEGTFSSALFIKEIWVNIQGICNFTDTFQDCIVLEHLTLGAIRDNIDLSTSPLITHESALRVLTDAYTVGAPDTKVKTITFHQQVIDRLSRADIKLATDKGWNILPLKPAAQATIQTAWVDAGLFTYTDANKNSVIPTDAGRVLATLPDVVDGEQLVSGNNMFKDMVNLATMPQVNLSNIRSADYMFYNTGFEQLNCTLPNVETWNHALRKCGRLLSANIQAPKCGYSEYGFADNPKVTHVTFQSNVLATFIYGVYYCTALETTNINLSKATNIRFAYSGSGIVTFNSPIPVASDMYGTFSKCPRFKHMNTPFPAVSNGSSTFANSPELLSVAPTTIGNGGYLSNMFINCGKLTDCMLNITRSTSLNNMFMNTPSIVNLRLGAIYNHVDIGATDKLSHATIVNILQELGTVAAAGTNHRSIVLHPTVFALLSADDIAIGTNKGWKVTG